MDPEAGMLVEAAGYAGAVGVGNVSWVVGSSGALPLGVRRFELVTMGRSFHWMDRVGVLRGLEGMVVEGGGLVIANDSCLVRPVTEWQGVVEEVQDRFVSRGRRVVLPFGDDSRSHVEVLRDSPFSEVDRVVHEFERVWTVEQVIGYLYSTSMPVLRVLGNRRRRFEDELRVALEAFVTDGSLIEPVSLEVLFATR